MEESMKLPLAPCTTVKALIDLPDDCLAALLECCSLEALHALRGAAHALRPQAEQLSLLLEKSRT